mmetsp:Transcript_87974/g.250974  ORF Transcript_87974/g.250974 Transcript_87974/m.250974 type:complete len:259 (+) Transcript_87974:1392-2168(+)
MMRITGSDESAFQELVSRRGPLSFLTSKRAGGVNPGQKLQMLTSVRAQCLRSEIRALEALRRLMDTTLQAYPTTLAQDRERLALLSGDEDNSPTPAPGNARTGARIANARSASQEQSRGRARTGICYGRPATDGGKDIDAGLFDLPAPLPKLSNARNAAIQVRGEKVVLHHYRRLATAGLLVLARDSGEGVVDAVAATGVRQTPTAKTAERISHAESFDYGHGHDPHGEAQIRKFCEGLESLAAEYEHQSRHINHLSK